MHWSNSLLLLSTFIWLTDIIYWASTQWKMLCAILHLHFADNLCGYWHLCGLTCTHLSRHLPFYCLYSCHSELLSSHQRPQILIHTGCFLYMEQPPFPSLPTLLYQLFFKRQLIWHFSESFPDLKPGWDIPDDMPSQHLKLSLSELPLYFLRRTCKTFLLDIP